MKKSLILAALFLGISGTAFAANSSTTDISSASTIIPGGSAIYGGIDTTAATNATNPLVKLSTGVKGEANFGATGYSVNTKHDSGSKVFGTANDSVAVYWKPATGALSTTISGTTVGSGNYSSGWQTY